MEVTRPHTLFFEEDLSVPAKLWWHHAKHVDPVAELQGDGHGEPAGAQPGVGFLPETQGHLFVKKREKNHNCVSEVLIFFWELLPKDKMDKDESHKAQS